MRKLTFAVASLVALAAAGIAVAHGIEGGSNPTAVASTFGASGKSTSSRSCTTSDGRTIVVTDGTYTGVAAGDADVAGTITLRARSVVDTTKAVGVVNGAFKIDVSSGADTRAAFTAVYDHGRLAGLAVGRAHAPGARLVANISAGFDPGTGFSGGKLGGGTDGGGAVELTPRACKSSPSRHERSEARGTISDLSSSSITVAGLTCALPQGSDVPTTFAKGDVVEIRCAYANGANTLTQIHKHGHT
jgi:hypothetical protein